MLNEPNFQLTWLRESSSGHLDFDSGTSVTSSRLELAILGLTPGGSGESTAPGRLPSHRLEVGHVQGALESLFRVQCLPKWFAWRLAAFFGGMNTEERVAEARRGFEAVRGMCDRIRALNLDRPWCEIYLPYFDRRSWNSRFEAFEALQFEQRNGWIQAAGANPESLESLVIRTAALIFQPRPATDVPFRFASYQCALEQPWAGMLADRWTVKIPAKAHVRSMELLLPGHSVESWRRSPRLHHGRHHQVWVRAALSMQWVLRRWSLAAHASTLEGLRDVESTLQLMVYNCLRPWAEGARPEPCYDVLDEPLMLASFRRSARRLPLYMEMAAKWLERSGHDALAEEYRCPRPSLEAARVVERCFRGRTVRNMLIAETGLVNASMRYSQEAKAAQAPRAIKGATETLVRAYDDHLPRIFRSPGMAKRIAPAIFMEVTSGLGVALGHAPTLEVRMETADGGVHRNDLFPQPGSLAA